MDLNIEHIKVVKLFYGKSCSFCGKQWTEDDVRCMWSRTVNVKPEIVACPKHLIDFELYVVRIKNWQSLD